MIGFECKFDCKFCVFFVSELGKSIKGWNVNGFMKWIIGDVPGVPDNNHWHINGNACVVLVFWWLGWASKLNVIVPYWSQKSYVYYSFGY